MIGSAATTRSPSRRTTSRSVPCVAGCCGPMLSTMSPVSSSTFTCASARCRNAAGSTSTSGSSPGGGEVVVGRVGHTLSVRLAPAVAPPSSRSPGHRLDVDESRPRLHLAREQREVLAQRVALELRRQDRGGAGSGGRRTRSRTSPTLRARASRRRDTPAPTTRRVQIVVVDVGLQDHAPVSRRVDSTTREHLVATGAARGAVRLSPSAARAPTCRPNPPRRRSAWASSRCRR